MDDPNLNHAAQRAKRERPGGARALSKQGQVKVLRRTANRETNAMSDNADPFDLIVEGCANYAADLFELTEGYANYAEAAIDLLLGYVEQEEG